MATENNNADALLKIARTLYPICELEEAPRRELTAQARLDTLSDHTTLAAESDRPWLTFLVRGELAVVTDGGAEEVIRADSPRARLPLFKIHPPGLHAIARTPSVLVRFDKKLFQQLQAQEQSHAGSGRHEEIVVSNAGNGESPVYLRIYQACSSGELELPTLPDIALRIREAIKDPHKSVKDVGRMVLADPVLSARLIHIANSAAYRRDTPATTVYQAVTRLGLEAAQNIAMSLALKNLFHAESSLLKQRMQALYSHSTQIASLSYVLARYSQGFSPERALLAGLLHDIGVIPILTFADSQPELAYDAAELERAIHRLRAISGHLVLNRMGFEADLITAAEDAEEWLRNSDKPADYADIVIVAQLHSYLGTPEMEHLPHIDATPAYRKLGLGEFDPKTGLAILRTANNVSSAIRELLQ